MILYKKMYDLLEYTSGAFPSKEAFVQGDISISWSDTRKLVLNIARWLETVLGDSEIFGDQRECIIDGDNCLLHVFMIMGLLTSYRVYIPHNRTLDRNKINIWKNTPKFEIKDNAMSFNGMELNLVDFLRENNLSNEVLANHEAPAVFYYTSGTTGEPKVIVSSNSNVIRGAEYVIEALKLRKNDVIAGTLLLDFDYGVNQIFCNLLLASTYVCAPFASMQAAWFDELLSHNDTVLPTMPFLIERYFPQKVANQNTSIRLCTSSGAPLTSQHVSRVTECFPNAEIIPMYGLSEGFRATILPPGMYELKPHSVGLPIGNTEIRIVNDQMVNCAPYEVGEILQSSGCVTWGYLNNELANNSKFVRDAKYPNKIYVRSGDLGYLDEHGYLYVKGRIEFQIKRFGIRISIDEIELAYKNILGIQNAVAIPMEVNETESSFAIGLVTDLSRDKIEIAIKRLPVEFQTKSFRVIPEVISNYNGGKPDREANRKTFFND